MALPSWTTSTATGASASAGSVATWSLVELGDDATVVGAAVLVVVLLLLLMMMTGSVELVTLMTGGSWSSFLVDLGSLPVEDEEDTDTDDEDDDTDTDELLLDEDVSTWGMATVT